MRITIKYSFFIWVFLNHINGFSQDTLKYNYEGVLDYALIEKKCFYNAYRNPVINKASYVLKKTINTESKPYVHYCSDSRDPRLPFIWTKNKNELYAAYFMHYKYKGPAVIDYREFQKLDIIQIKSLPNTLIKEESFSIAPLNDYNWALITHRPYLSDSIVETYIYALSFDITIEKDSILTFYLSDKDALYLWECVIPPKGAFRTDWKEKTVYASINFKEDFIPRSEFNSYTGKNTILNAIKDTLFFDGHFKVIDQNKEKFIINREHGNIYYLGKKKIEKIGKVELIDNYLRIEEKRLFIEDRDNNQLIFFAPVEWMRDDLPKPNVRIITDEKEFKEMFKYVLE